MLIESSSASRPPHRGDFGATVKDGRLLMPRIIFERLSAGQIRTAEDLIGFLQVFPATLAGDLGWEVSDVDAAKTRLLETLRRYIRPEFFSEEPAFTPRYGVRPRSR